MVLAKFTMHVWSLLVFLEANSLYWMTKFHQNKNKDECVDNEITVTDRWLLLPILPVLKVCEMNRRIFQHSLLFSQPLSESKFDHLFCVFTHFKSDTLFRLNKFLQNLRLKPLNVILTNTLETPKQVCIFLFKNNLFLS